MGRLLPDNGVPAVIAVLITQLPHQGGRNQQTADFLFFNAGQLPDFPGSEAVAF